jgi:MFS family permease
MIDAKQRTPGALQGILLLLPITMNVMGLSVLTPVVQLILDHFSYLPSHDYLIMGGVLTMPAIWVLIFSPFAGLLADRYGRRNLLLLAMVAYAILGAAPAVIDNLYLIIATRAGVGICESVVITVTTTMIGDYFKGRARERWLASQTIVACSSALGIIYLGGVLGSALGWRGPFYLYLYSLLLALPVLLFVWEPVVEASDATARTADSLYVRFPWARMIGICSLSLLGSISFYTAVTQNAPALNTLGVSDPSRIGLLTMLAGIGVPLGTVMYLVAARLRTGWLVAVDFALIGAGFVLMGLASDPTAYVWGAFVNQLGCGLVLPTMLVWATRGLAYSIRGRGTGMWQATHALGQFVSGMLITLLSKHLGGILPTFGTMGIAAIILAALAAVAGVFWSTTVPLSDPARTSLV